MAAKRKNARKGAAKGGKTGQAAATATGKRNSAPTKSALSPKRTTRGSSAFSPQEKGVSKRKAVLPEKKTRTASQSPASSNRQSRRGRAVKRSAGAEESDHVSRPSKETDSAAKRKRSSITQQSRGQTNAGRVTRAAVEMVDSKKNTATEPRSRSKSAGIKALASKAKAEMPKHRGKNPQKTDTPKQKAVTLKHKATPSKQKATPSKQKETPSKQKATPSKQKATPPKQKATPSKQKSTSKTKASPSKKTTSKSSPKNPRKSTPRSPRTTPHKTYDLGSSKHSMLEVSVRVEKMESEDIRSRYKSTSPEENKASSSPSVQSSCKASSNTAVPIVSPQKRHCKESNSDSESELEKQVEAATSEVMESESAQKKEPHQASEETMEVEEQQTKEGIEDTAVQQDDTSVAVEEHPVEKEGVEKAAVQEEKESAMQEEEKKEENPTVQEEGPTVLEMEEETDVQEEQAESPVQEEEELLEVQREPAVQEDDRPAVQKEEEEHAVQEEEKPAVQEEEHAVQEEEKPAVQEEEYAVQKEEKPAVQEEEEEPAVQEEEQAVQEQEKPAVQEEEEEPVVQENQKPAVQEEEEGHAVQEEEKPAIQEEEEEHAVQLKEEEPAAQEEEKKSAVQWKEEELAVQEEETYFHKQESAELYVQEQAKEPESKPEVAEQKTMKSVDMIGQEIERITSKPLTASHLQQLEIVEVDSEGDDAEVVSDSLKEVNELPAVAKMDEETPVEVIEENEDSREPKQVQSEALHVAVELISDAEVDEDGGGDTAGKDETEKMYVDLVEDVPVVEISGDEIENQAPSPTGVEIAEEAVTVVGEPTSDVQITEANQEFKIAATDCQPNGVTSIMSPRKRKHDELDDDEEVSPKKARRSLEEPGAYDFIEHSNRDCTTGEEDFIVVCMQDVPPSGSEEVLRSLPKDQPNSMEAQNTVESEAAEDMNQTDGNQTQSDMSVNPVFHRSFILNPAFNSANDTTDHFTLVSYNVLADFQIRRNDYSFTKKEYLVPEYRFHKLLQEIQYLDGDVVCLQEVEPEFFKDLLQPRMESLGYKGVFKKRTTDFYNEGEATFYRTCRFTEVESVTYRLADLVEKEIVDGMSREIQAAIRGYMDRADVLIITKLRCKVTGKEVTVGNIHVVWGEMKVPDAQCVQIASAVKEVVSKAGNVSAPHIICGDFNSIPNSSGYLLARDGYLGDDTIPELQQISGLKLEDGRTASLVNCAWPAFQHTSSTLKSAYCEVQGSEPKVTSYNRVMCTCVDYIFYSSGSLDIVGVYETAPSGKIMETGGIPNCYFPSDHVSVKAKLSFK